MRMNQLEQLVTEITHMPYPFGGIDLDGTTLNKLKQISGRNRAAINALDRLAMCLPVTGRAFEHSLAYYYSLGLRGPIVASDGANVRIPGGEVLREKFIEPAVAAELTTIAAGPRSQLSRMCQEVFAQ